MISWVNMVVCSGEIGELRSERDSSGGLSGSRLRVISGVYFQITLASERDEYKLENRFGIGSGVHELRTMRMYRIDLDDDRQGLGMFIYLRQALVAGKCL